VDDGKDMLALGKIFLEQNGQFSVTTAVSAPVALALLKSENFDVIVSDYQMPEMDGIVFLRRVRDTGNTIPFILFTVWEREKNITRALNEGADSYIQKGIDARSRYAELSDAIIAARESRAIKEKQWKEGKSGYLL
jgi:CheY-like chemotaxis protein